MTSFLQPTSQLESETEEESTLAKAIRMGRENVSKDALLLRSMLDARSPVQDIIESYNDWIEHGLRRTIEGQYAEYRYYDATVKHTRLCRIECQVINVLPPQLPRAVPTVFDSNQTAPFMTPALARLWKIPYAITVVCKFSRRSRIFYAEEDVMVERQIVRYSFDDQWVYDPEPKSGYTFQFQLPCMVGSKWCNTIDIATGRRKPKEDLMRMGEDPESPGAVIYSNGLAYQFPYKDKPQQFKNFVLPPKDKSGNNNPFVKQTVETDIATAQNQIIMDKTNVLRFQSNFFKKSDNINIVNSINILHLISFMFRHSPFTIPAFSTAGPAPNPYEKAGPMSLELLYYLHNFEHRSYEAIAIDRSQGNPDVKGVYVSHTGTMGENTPEFRQKIIAMFKYILRNLTSREEYAQIMLILPETITDFESKKYSQVEKEILQWVNMATAPVSDQRRVLTNICVNGIFPSIEKTELDNKLWMLGTMTVKLLKVVAGFDKPTSRDHWSNKYLQTAGDDCHGVFRRMWGHVFMDFRNNVDKLNNSFDGKPIPMADFVKAIKIRTAKIQKEFHGLLSGKKDANSASKSKRPNNLIEILELGSPLKIITLLCKISSNIDTNSKNLRFRAVQSDQPYYVCPYSTPDDKLCGITKFKAISAIVARRFNFEAISLPFLIELGLIVPANLTSNRPGEMLTPVLVNGTFRGWCNGPLLYKALTELRCRYRETNNRIDPFTSFFMAESGFFEIYSTAGRLLRPVLVLDDASKRIKAEVDGHMDWSFTRLFHEGYIVFIGPDEGDYITIAARPVRLEQWINDRDRANEDVIRLTQEIDDMRQNLDIDPEVLRNNETALQYRAATLARLQRNPYHYCALHPLSIFAASAATAPFSNHNAAVRVSFNSKLTKQALSLPLINQHHADMALPFVTQPVVDTALSRELQHYPAGRTVRLAILAKYTNMEDAVVVSRRFAQSWSWLQTRTYQAIISNKGGGVTRSFQKPSYIKPEFASNYFALTRDGFPAIGAYLKENDYVIGMVDTNGEKVIDKSIPLGIGESGWVHDVIYRELDSKKKLSVLLTEIKHLSLGDKLTSRYSQKVTIGEVMDDESMPFFAGGPNAGQFPDMLMNPHALPSRMTVGKMIEMITGKTAMMSGQIYDGTSYEYYSPEKLADALLKEGFHPRGSERMRDGVTGELMQCWVYEGPVYYFQLPHIAEEKIQARGGHGPIDVFTRQALCGRSNEGGVRFGEMEKDSTQAYQAKEFMRERMFKYSDPYSAVVCRDCGMISSFVFTEKKHKCFMGSCARVKGFANLELPYSFVLMQRLLMSVGVLVQMDVETLEEHVERLEFEKTKQINPKDLERHIDDDIDYDDEGGVLPDIFG